MNYKFYQYNTKYTVHLLVLIGFVMQMPLAVRQAVFMRHPFGRKSWGAGFAEVSFGQLQLTAT
jgi:hypothetical protein